MAHSSSIGLSLPSWAAEWTHTAIRSKPKANPKKGIAWHILGAGAIGQLLATKIVEAGLDVTLVTRPKPDPVRVNLEIQRAHLSTTKIFVLASESANFANPIQQLLVTTKSNQVLQALADIGPRLNSTSKIVLLHNGMGTLEAAQQQFSPAQIYCGTTTEGAYRSTARLTAGTQETSSQLIYAGQGTTEIGQMGQSTAPTWIQPLINSSLGFSWQSNIEEVLWRKLLINCAINPLTAIHNCRNGELLANPTLKAELRLIVEELANVAKAVGHQRLASNLFAVVQQVLTQTQDNYASMQQDVQHQRATEIAYINGYLCARAKAKGIATPLNENLVRAVQQLDQACNFTGKCV